MYTAAFMAINRALRAWGYLDDPRNTFQSQIKLEYEAHSHDDGPLKTWVGEKERWLLEG